ncbi:hypothetical protein [Neopusillimonas maritima]|uniref:Uncharacterized protein n=1 Tax=Neopusillimonas maritima TaxID=2026239 RepID=A0ABX9MZF7_9BURK|nr:hypothetical protein [Neopusillimonas maritima]RII84365.1 hypothetical protein CJO09_03900 [Neopusillimonas maritima]
MDKQLKSLMNVFTQDVTRAAIENRLPSRDLVDLCEIAMRVAKGSATISELLQVSQIMKDSDDPKESGAALNDAEVASLLGLLHASSLMFVSHLSIFAEGINDDFEGSE